MEDNKIIELYLNRDESALLQTSAKYGAYCSTIAFNILGSAEDARECMNDTLLRTWKSIPPAKPSSLKSYLGRIARNLALDRYDQRTAEKRGGDQVDLALEELSECIADNKEELNDGEITAVINAFLETQDKQKRIIFVKRYFNLESVKDIAKEMSISESNVKTTLFRLRTGLREALQKEGINI